MMKIKNIEETVKKIQNGERELLEDFIISYDKYIQNIVSRYSFYSDRDDLLQVARLHLVKSCYSYKFNIANFMQYSNYRIHTEIQRYIYRNINNILNDEEKYDFCIKAYEKCRSFIKKEPTVFELGKYIGINSNYAEEILSVINSLSENNRYKKQEAVIYDFDEYANDSFIKDKILSSNLTDKQKDVLIKKYIGENGICYTEQEIAKKYGVTRQNIDNIDEAAINSLKKKKYFKYLNNED